jgi:hypothetical protein
MGCEITISAVSKPSCFLTGRRQEFLPFLVVGILCVIAGGLDAAATAPAPTEHGTWSAAYLVLVCGVAQAGLGVGQALSTTRSRTSVVAMQVAGWNLGNAAVLIGTVTEFIVLVDVGGALLFVILVLLARELIVAGVWPVNGVQRWFRYGYGLLILILLLSVPTGVILAHVRT